MRSVAPLTLILLAGCFPSLFEDPCDPDCSTRPRSPNAEGLICVPESNLCVECARDSQCKTSCGGDGRCRPCAEDEPCQDNLACVDGACVSCTEDRQCGAGEVCLDGDCGRPCDSEAACEAYAGLVWNALQYTDGRGAYFGCTYRAQDKLLCTGKGLYPEALVCDPCLTEAGGAPCAGCTPSGDCPCETTSDCPPGSACRAGICGACRRDSECRPGEFCGEGTCRDKCTSDADCPGGRCALERGACLACLEDTDCAAGKRCYFDGCVTPCTGDDACFPTACSPMGRCALCSMPPRTEAQ